MNINWSYSFHSLRILEGGESYEIYELYLTNRQGGSGGEYYDHQQWERIIISFDKTKHSPRPTDRFLLRPHPLMKLNKIQSVGPNRNPYNNHALSSNFIIFFIL
ncbi:hypothetical protein DFA_12364 [Cavenderia fasciculata]|uniref:Uncharacterized protein n=1 Tax=Cavenderia fasciculata TaxID=261658 RepID=F4QDG9_CACFS|nr:uncharacterized protein DFA_12364 [Cavenderia fasciculata]EGG14587.1 hypothetical protein DFA_12364 [Cavenderia fasciculata]|eukprot:XP_004366107.1 hypothetical protein DFA_12364 [Cavenderia fasciculata]